MSRLSLVQGDITKLTVDAIVNAANERLLGGAGVDGAIHAAAGAGLLSACRSIAEVRPGVRCPTGQARITPGFDLPAKLIIHTVGPVWRGGHAREDDLLASCYRESLALAEAHQATSIAFPSISCGGYGFPVDRAVAFAVREIHARIAASAIIERAILVAFDASMLRALEQALDRAAERGSV